MSNKQVVLEKTGSVASITLNRPQALNALNPELLEQLGEALDECAEDSSLRALLLTGAGRGFCAGADLSGGGGTVSSSADSEQLIDTVFNPVIRKLIDMPLPTVCAVNGVAAGGGFGLALSCDLVISAEDAKFILVFTNQLGLIPDMGSTWLAPRLMGRVQAIAAAFFGEPISAAEAVEMGLIWKCVASSKLMETAMQTATRLSNGPTRAYPLVRQAFDMAYFNTMDQQLKHEAKIQPGLIASNDFAEGVRAFRSKRRPEFTGS